MLRTGLTSDRSKDYGFTTEGGRDVVLNVCRGVAQEVWNIDDADTVGAFIRQDHGDFSLGCVDCSSTLSSTHKARSKTANRTRP